MAFLVCYSRSTSDHCKSKAIYLDQQFYELTWGSCRIAGGPYLKLRDIALLRYKSPCYFIPVDQLGQLAEELGHLANSFGPAHPQIAGFRNVCQKALEADYGLTISGDMYPELTDD